MNRRQMLASFAVVAVAPAAALAAPRHRRFGRLTVEEATARGIAEDSNGRG